jgi:hypothetical protein
VSADGLSRRRVLVALGTVGCLGALGGGATGAYLSDEERGAYAVSSGDVRLIDCSGGAGDAPPTLGVSLSFERNDLVETVTTPAFGVVTNPAWLVVGLARCPPTDADAAALFEALTVSDLRVRVGGETVRAGTDGRVVAAIDPATPGDDACAVSATIRATVTLDPDGVEDLTGAFALDLFEVLVVQRRNVTAAAAVDEFVATFPDDADCPPVAEPRVRPRYAISYVAFCFEPGVGPVDRSTVTRATATGTDGDGPLAVAWTTREPVAAIAYKTGGPGGGSLYRLDAAGATSGEVRVGDGSPDPTFDGATDSRAPCPGGLVGVKIESFDDGPTPPSPPAQASGSGSGPTDGSGDDGPDEPRDGSGGPSAGGRVEGRGRGG